MTKFTSSHTIPGGTLKREQANQSAEGAQDDTTVRRYRSILNLSDGKLLCIMEAPSKEALVLRHVVSKSEGMMSHLIARPAPGALHGYLFWSGPECDKWTELVMFAWNVGTEEQAKAQLDLMVALKGKGEWDEEKAEPPVRRLVAADRHPQSAERVEE